MLYNKTCLQSSAFFLDLFANLSLPEQAPKGLSQYFNTDQIMAYQIALPWNEGEEEMHRILHVPDRDNPTSPFLTPYGAQILTRSPLLALGTLDAEGRPWTTLWGGQPGFSRPIGQSIIGVKTTIDRIYDPVIGAVVGTEHDGEVVDQDGPGKMVGGLAIDLQTRNRVKLYGRSVASAISTTEPGIGEIQLVVRIEQSLGKF